MNSLFAKWNIDRNSPCPCRSGKKYKKCCYLTLGTDLKTQGIDLYSQKNFGKAESAFRATLTQYIKWYHEHTVPWVLTDPDKADQLLLVDIDALIYLLDSITRCLFEQKKLDEIDIFLQRASDIINDVRYSFYLASRRAAWFGILGDFEEARKAMRTVAFIDVIAKIPKTKTGKMALEIFLDILCIELPFSRGLQIIDWLLNCANNPIKKTKLLTKKAFLHFIYLDSLTANTTIDEAIFNTNDIKPTDQRDHVLSLFAIAEAYDVKSVVSNDGISATKAITVYKDLYPFLSDDPASLRWLNNRIAHLYDFFHDYQRAQDYYLASFEINSSTEILIALSKVSVLSGKVDEAIKYLNKIDLNDDEKNQSLDYLRVQAEIAINKNDHLLAKKLESHLLSLELSIPIDREIRNNIRLMLLEMLATKNTSKSALQKLRDIIARYLILQPTIFGIGINLNEIIKPKDTKE